MFKENWRVYKIASVVLFIETFRAKAEWYYPDTTDVCKDPVSIQSTSMAYLLNKF